MFEPYIIPMGLKGRYFRVENEQGKSWYDPMKWYTLLEYQWVIDNVALDGERVIDAGGHHGHYSLVLADKNTLNIVEPHPANVTIIRANLAENGLYSNVIQGAVAGKAGIRSFSGETNGRLVNSGAFDVDCWTLDMIDPDAGIIKIDIEGGEYDLFPAAIEMMTKAHTWIIELHPQFGNPNLICAAFLKAGYDALKVCRVHGQVEPYDIEEPWESHATVIFRRTL